MFWNKDSLIKYVENSLNIPLPKEGREAVIFAYNELFVRPPARGRNDDRFLKALLICCVYPDLYKILKEYKKLCMGVNE